MHIRGFSRRNLVAICFQQCLLRDENICTSHSLTFQRKNQFLNKTSVNLQLRSSSNIVESPFPKIDISQILVQEMIWDTVDRYPEAIALKCGVSGRLYKYAEIQKLSRRFTNSLIKAGFSYQDVVAVVLPNCPEFAIIALGLLDADLTVSLVDNVYTPDEISQQLKDSRCVCVVSGVEQLPSVQAAISKLEESLIFKPIRKIIAVDIPSPASLPEGVVRFSEMIGDNVDHSKQSFSQKRPNEMAFLPYSSGTTGLPKGVCLSHSNIVSNILQYSSCGVEANGPDKGQDLLLGLLPFHHIYGLVVILLYSLKQGSQTITLPKFEQQTFIRAFENEKLSVLFLVPPLILFLGLSSEIKGEKHLSNVKFLISGAAPLGDTDMEKLKVKIPADNNCFLAQGYGMTELSPVATVPTLPPKNLATCGVPIPNTQGKIICPDTGEALGPNQTGEVCFRGPQVMMGYLNNSKATTEIIDEDGWLRTGDMGYYDEDLHFYIQYRLKELIKVKGFQVPPAELEAVLRTHSDVSDVGVIGVPDPRSGELPVAYVVRSKGTSLTEDQVKEFLSGKVAKHKQVHRVIFVDSIPKSDSGTILRRDLRKMYNESEK